MRHRLTARQRLARLAALATALAALLAGLVTATGPATAAAPVKPVVNGAVFNDPTGTTAQQSAVFTQLIDLINAVPAGETIRGSIFEMEDMDVANALLAAYRRGVDVKMIVDQQTVAGDSRDGHPAWDALSNASTGLGTDDAKASYIVACNDQFPSARRGCIATPPPNPSYNHNKFFVFSKIGPFSDGTSYTDVVFQSSSNLNYWYKEDTYNDSVTFTDPTVYNGYVKVHNDERTLRYNAKGNDSYYWSTPTGSTYRAFYFPRGDSSYNNPSTDTVVNILNGMTCKYTGSDGKAHTTAIKVAMFQFLTSRQQVATALAGLAKKGCSIDVLYSESDSTVQSALTSAGVHSTQCSFDHNGIDIRTHTKLWLVDGMYDGGTTPRVYTGSHNWTGSALRSADETMLRISSATYYAQYLAFFNKLSAACGA